MIIWKWIYERLKEMISVCIPIYNYYAYPLVRRLVTQRDNLKNPGEVEIVCIDDHSSGYYLSQNNGIVGAFVEAHAADDNVGLTVGLP